MSHRGSYWLVMSCIPVHVTWQVKEHLQKRRHNKYSTKKILLKNLVSVPTACFKSVTSFKNCTSKQNEKVRRTYPQEIFTMFLYLVVLRLEQGIMHCDYDHSTAGVSNRKIDLDKLKGETFLLCTFSCQNFIAFFRMKHVQSPHEAHYQSCCKNGGKMKLCYIF